MSRALRQSLWSNETTSGPVHIVAQDETLVLTGALAVVCVLMLMLICFISRVARDLASVNARLVVLEDLAVRKPSHVRNERSHLMKYDSQWGTCNPLRTVTQSVPVDYARAHEVTPEAHTACAV